MVWALSKLGVRTARRCPWADSYTEGRQSISPWMPRRQAKLSDPLPSPSPENRNRGHQALLLVRCPGKYHARYILALHQACAKCWETEGTQERKEQEFNGKAVPCPGGKTPGEPSAGPVGQRLQDGRRLLSLAFTWLGAQTRTAGGAEGGEGADSPDERAWNFMPLPAWWSPSRSLPSSHIWGGGHPQLGPERM